MFDFEKLVIYQKAKVFHKNILELIATSKTDRVIANQLKRAALSIPLNIAEGTSRYSKADRRNFCVIARGSVFECVAILDILKDKSLLREEEHKVFYSCSEEMSKMLYAMIQKLE